MSVVKSAGIVAAALVLLVLIGLGIRQTQSGGDGPTPETSASGGPSFSSTIGPTADPSPYDPTPVPTIVQRPGQPVTGTVEENGIRVTLVLDRDRIAYGERAWADVTVVNTGTDDVYWGHPLNCDFAASVSVMTQQPLELAYGRTDWPGDLDVLKSVTIGTEPLSIGLGEVVAYFSPEAWIDLIGGRGCVTMGVTEILPSGGQLTYRSAWDADGPYGVPMRRSGVPTRPGEYQVAAAFYYMTRGFPPGTEPIDNLAVEAAVPLIVDSPNVEYLSPGETVDRVLANPDFLDLYQDAPRSRWQASTLDFEDGGWVMRLYLDGPHEAIVVHVNAISGRVTNVVLDPNPGEPVF